MNDEQWRKVYDAGTKTGRSLERVRILQILEEHVSEVGKRAIELRNNAADFRDGTDNKSQLKALAEVAEYEQQAYLKVMKKINEENV